MSVTWEPPEAAGPAGGAAPSPTSRPTSRPADGGTSPPAPPQPMGPFIPGDRSPTPPALSRVGAEGPRPPGLKFKLLVKKKKRSWNKERKHPFRHPVLHPPQPLLPCLLNVGSAATAENNIPHPADCPTFLSPLSVDKSRPQATSSCSPWLFSTVTLRMVHLELQIHLEKLSSESFLFFPPSIPSGYDWTNQ